MTDERAMPPDLFHQLTLTILDRSTDEGLRTIKSIRSLSVSGLLVNGSQLVVAGSSLVVGRGGPS